VKRYVAISDLQYPYIHKPAVRALTQFIADYQPDELLCVGDELDAPEPSRWNKGMAGEYAKTLQKSIDGCADLMAEFQEAACGVPFHVQRSNHTDRIETYVRRYAPALTGLRELRTESLLRYEETGIVYHRSLYEFTPGVVLAHGDEGAMSSIGGMTGLKLAKKIGKSVVLGHCHRLGVVSTTTGFNGSGSTITALETGHLMNMRQAHYLPSGSGDWQLGFGVIEVEGVRRTFYPVPMASDGSFTFQGQLWK
jgi:hypothetical protein